MACWPAETCVPVQGGVWEIEVPLPEEGSPDVLDLDAQLMLQAWQRDHPSVEAVFWFDIVGPPAP